MIQQLSSSIFQSSGRIALCRYIYLFMQAHSERAINLPSSSLNNKHRNLQMIKHCTRWFQVLLATATRNRSTPSVPYCVSLYWLIIKLLAATVFDSLGFVCGAHYYYQQPATPQFSFTIHQVDGGESVTESAKLQSGGGIPWIRVIVELFTHST